MKIASKTLRHPEDDVDPEFAAGVNEGLADAKAGRLVPYEKVRRWLLSWGSEKQPRSRRARF